MAQRSSTIVDDSGAELVSLVADTEMRGISINVRGIWHSPVLLDRYCAEIQTMNQWLRDNGVE